MSPDELRALAEALDKITPVMGLEELHHMETLDRAADYLRACAEQRPDGWRLVPAEPTEAMKSAGGHVNSEWLNDDAPLYESRYAMPMDGVWSAMLAAAPAVPQAEPTEAQIEARDALLDFLSENGTASEGVQYYLDRYVRAALAAKEG